MLNSRVRAVEDQVKRVVLEENWIMRKTVLFSRLCSQALGNDETKVDLRYQVQV